MFLKKFEWMVASRYLRPSKKEGAISVIASLSFVGILLGVAALIIVMSVMNGFRAELLKSILGFNGHIGIYAPANEGIRDFDDLTEELRARADIVSATPLIERQGMLSARGVAVGALVHGIKGVDLQARSLISSNLISGSLKHFHEGATIVIGKRLSEQLGLYPGDRITIITPQGDSTAFGNIPKMRTFTVTAIFEVGMKDYDSNVVFIPIEQAQTFFNYPDAVNGIEIFVQDAEKVFSTSRALKMQYPNLRMIDWQQANNSFFNSLKVERNVMFLILTLIILVAALNIISSLIMLVKDKAQDIAILRTMGATKRSIMRIFFLSGSMIGLSGIVVGAFLGLIFSYNIESIRRWIESFTGTNLFSAEVYFLSTLPSQVNPNEVITIILVALVLVLLSSIVPAWRAARLDPVEALRYE